MFLKKMGNKHLFFDLDGTLYPLDGETFKDSKIYSELMSRSLEFLCSNLGIDEWVAGKKYDDIARRYNFLLSEGFEKEFGLPREKYLDFAWDMNPSKYMSKNPALKCMLSRLSPNYRLSILSDAPNVWISRVLKYLEINNIFQNIFSGGSLRVRKNNGLFEYALKVLGADAQDCCMIGDELENDVQLPIEHGLKSIHLRDGTDILDIERVLPSVMPAYIA